jgi:hypothetical protein
MTIRHRRNYGCTLARDSALSAELDHRAILAEIDAYARQAQAALETENRIGNPTHGRCIAQVQTRIDRYGIALEQSGWTKKQINDDKAKLFRRLTECWRDGHTIAGSIYSAAMRRLETVCATVLHPVP